MTYDSNLPDNEATGLLAILSGAEQETPSFLNGVLLTPHEHMLMVRTLETIHWKLDALRRYQESADAQLSDNLDMAGVTREDILEAVSIIDAEIQYWAEEYERLPQERREP